MVPLSSVCPHHALLSNLVPPPATPAKSFLAIMEADRPIHVVVAFSGEEKKLDTARRFFPLVADNRLHDISLRFFVLGQDGRGSVPGF